MSQKKFNLMERINKFTKEDPILFIIAMTILGGIFGTVAMGFALGVFWVLTIETK